MFSIFKFMKGKKTDEKIKPSETASVITSVFKIRGGKEFVGKYLPSPFSGNKFGYQYATKNGVLTVFEIPKTVRPATDEEATDIKETMDSIENAWVTRFLNVNDL